jgi:hypothetical protein
VDSINLDSLVTTGNEGYLPVLECLREALLQVEEHILQQFGQQMTQVLGDRRPDLDAEKIRVFVRRCVRRQVESAIYLPLRRAVFRIVYSFTAVRVSLLLPVPLPPSPLAPSRFDFTEGSKVTTSNPCLEDSTNFHFLS